jgi:hypothetical protein
MAEKLDPRGLVRLLDDCFKVLMYLIYNYRIKATVAMGAGISKLIDIISYFQDNAWIRHRKFSNT